MLVIRRRAGETVCIGEDIEVEVLAVAGSQVKLGIRAPRSVAVVREEIRTVGEQNRRAARMTAAPELSRLLEALKKPAGAPIRAV
jgi:carbon storage regulator